MSEETAPDETKAAGARLNAGEVDAEIRALFSSPADLSRLKSIAASLRGGIVDLSAGDLLQETLTRFYEKRRTWPRGVHPLVVMKSAMHSVASDARKRHEFGSIDATVALATEAQDQDATDARPQVHGTSSITPEDERSGKEQLAAVYAAVAGDEDLEYLVMVWADGLRGADAAQALGWDKKKYEAARKRLTRRLNAVDTDRRTT